MILQALYEYYERRAEKGDGLIAPQGFEWKEIGFVIVLNEKGRFLALEDTKEGEGRARRAKSFLVPQAVRRTGKTINANLLWDNVEYALGANPRNRSDVRLRHEAFKERLKEADKAIPTAVRAMKTFLENEPLKIIEASQVYSEKLRELLTRNENVTFRIEGKGYASVCEEYRENLKPKEEIDEKGEGICLITGQKGKISRLNPPIKGVKGTKTSGAALVSFNLPAFESFLKKQNYNAPISEEASFAYTTALNTLLRRGSTNSVVVGDTSAVFWADRQDSTGYDFEKDFSWFFAEPPKDDPDRGIRAVRALYEALYSGILPTDGGNRFYILGLAPNAARIAVRFSRAGSITEFAVKIKKHFDDLEIDRTPRDAEYLPLNQILRAIALDRKMENVPPNLAGAVVESILDGKPYPITLMQQCLRRIRAERRVTRARAAILKAYLNRFSFHRSNPHPGKEEITVCLDRTNASPGYRLGRLFAVLEKIQEEANPGINATIRDRFYGAASSSPVAVFPQLLKLKNHHLARLDNLGRKVNLEKEIGEIFCELKDFPPHLSMDEQARFAVGYYHQRQSFFSK